MSARHWINLRLFSSPLGQIGNHRYDLDTYSQAKGWGYSCKMPGPCGGGDHVHTLYWYVSASLAISRLCTIHILVYPYECPHLTEGLSNKAERLRKGLPRRCQSR